MRGWGRVAVSAVVTALGVWLFAFPFVASSIGAPLSTTASSSMKSSARSSGAGMMGSGHMSGDTSMSMNNGSNGMGGGSTGMGGGMSAASGSGGGTGRTASSTTSSQPKVVLDRAALVSDLVPGVLVATLGVYLLISAIDDRRETALV